MPLTIASWNINSVRIRTHLIAQLLDLVDVDILLLQETKTEDVTFPKSELEALGFSHLYYAGQKSYNGVAILARMPLGNVLSVDMIGSNEARHISATLPDGTEIHNFYVPAGGDIPDVNENPKFADKLKFVEAMTDWAKGQKGKSMIIAGDLNIAPLEQDVWSHKQLLKVVSHTPIETDALAGFKDSLDWCDTHRHIAGEEEKLYSWWSYRARDWLASNRGRRLDHIWITPDLTGRLLEANILSEARGWEKPSDHVPIITTLDL